ncbi:MAG TPA: ABC transporter permease [Candidatus Limnocylindrales bacterium]
MGAVSALEMIRLALSRLRTARIRAALTMLGVIIGVASVVALVGVGQGTTSQITSQLNSLGTNLLTISPTGRNGSSTTLSLADAEAISQLDGVAAVEPELSTSGVVGAGTTTTSTTVIGTSTAYMSVRAYDMWQGTFLTDTAEATALRQVVLGATVATNLGLTAEAVGSNVSINGLAFEVVGIMQPKGGSGFQDPDNEVLIPIGTAQKYFAGSGGSVRTIGLSVSPSADMTAVSDSITSLLETRHGIAAGGTDDFSIITQAQLLQTAATISGTLELLLGGIASISLVVGGIGIMNIMLVSVRERTREIGIRKAIGARARDILSQFLIEALTLSLLGGLIGIAIGLAVSAGIARFAGWAFHVDPATIALATVFSLVVGIVFGVWPARQAARLDPIAALRYE